MVQGVVLQGLRRMCKLCNLLSLSPEVAEAVVALRQYSKGSMLVSMALLICNQMLQLACQTGTQ